jgi:amino acid transporter
MTDRPVRELTQTQIFSLAFGSIIGVAWIPLAGFWIQSAGSLGAVIAFASGCITVMFVVAAYAEISSMHPVNGGEVSYAQISLGSGFSFAAGWMLILLYLGFTSFEMISIGWIAGILIPAIKGPVLYSVLGSEIHVGELTTGLLCNMIVWWLNIRGKGSAARVQNAMAFGLLIFAFLILLFALAWGHIENLQPIIAHPVNGGRLAGIFSIFSISMLFYGGFNFAAQCFGERGMSVTPRRIALLMFLSLLAAFFFYVAIILSCSLLLPRAELLALELPAATMFEAAIGSRLLRDVVLIVGIIGLVTSWNGAVLAGSRLLAMLSEIRLLPESLSHVNPIHKTPAYAVAFLSILTPLIALIGQGGIFQVAKVLSFAIAFAWTVTVLSVVKLRVTRPESIRPYRVKSAGFVFSFAIAGTIFALFQTGKDFLLPGSTIPSTEGFIALAWIALGCVCWILTGKRRRSISEHDRSAIIAQLQ